MMQIRAWRFRRPGVSRAVALVGCALLAVTACGGDDDSTSETTLGGGPVELPQNPSLRLFVDVDAVVVENDGNVTMSEVEVRDGSGDVLCDLGTLAPEDLEPCDDADGVADAAVFGVGPQGQQVEAGLS